MKIYKDLLSEISNLFKKFSISEFVELRISKVESYDYQINNLVRHSHHQDIGEVLSGVSLILKKSKMVEDFEIGENLFINIRIDANKILPKLKNIQQTLQVEKPKEIIIDYGGPNIGKPLHVGHLRPLNIGRSIYSINNIVGNKMYSDIHLGDWGMPVAQIITYCQKRDIEVSKLSVEMLEEIYPKASSEYNNNDAFRKNAQQTNKKLTTGDSQTKSEWKSIRTMTLSALKETFTILNHDFDYWWGESTVNNLIPKMISHLLDNSKIERDSGAFISSQDTDPRILITKSDGSYLYITTDLATVILRNEKIPHEKVIYVTDNRQKLHFEQLFKSIKFFDFPEKDYEHIGFGTINDHHGNPLKTRDGGNLKLSELYEQTFSYIKKFNSTLSQDDINCLTNTVLTYSDLITNRKTDYKFDLEKFTNVSGKTGIYVQYAQVRAKRLIESLIQKEISNDNNLSDVLNSIERDLIINFANFEFFLELSLKNSEPHHVANYLYETSNLFNAFYEDSKIKNLANGNKKNQKIFIVNLFIEYSHLVMKCLGIKPAEKM